MKHKKAKAALIGVTLSKTPLPLRDTLYTLACGLSRGVEKFF